MRRMLYYRLAGRDVHLPKLIGAFVLLASLLMFFQAGAIMFDSWDNLKDIQSCLDAVKSNSTTINVCQQQAFYAFDNVAIRANQQELTSRQVGAALLGPIAHLFWWATIFIIGLIFYKSGNLVVPIEESVRTVPTSGKWPKKKKSASN